MNTFERLDTEHLDCVDAALFSGDMFSDENNRKLLREYFVRWETKLKEWDEIQNESEKP